MKSTAALETMNSKKLSYPSGLGVWLAATLSILSSLAFLSDLQATPPKNTVVATINVGSSPGSLVCSPDNKFVYVSIAGGIAVIDARTNRLSTNFSLPGSQIFLAIAPDGKTLYASADVVGSQWVQVISIANQSVTATIPFIAPGEITVTPDGSQLWVCDFEVNDYSGGIYVIDTATNTVTGGPIVINEEIPLSVVFTPDGTEAYALYSSFSIPAYLVEIKTSTQRVVNQNVANRALHGPPSGRPREPTLLSMDPNGETMYVFETAGKFWIDAVAVSNHKATRFLPAGPSSDYYQTITPNGKYLYIYELSGVSVEAKVDSINVETGEVAGPTVTVGLPSSTYFDLTTIAITPNGKYAYVSNPGDGTVTVIDIQE